MTSTLDLQSNGCKSNVRQYIVHNFVKVLKYIYYKKWTLNDVNFAKQQDEVNEEVFE